jgi:hypothetical protein
MSTDEIMALTRGGVRAEGRQSEAGLSNLAARLANCQGVLVDSNILLDIATNDPKWAAWSGQALAECAEHAALVINPIIYAEVSIGFKTIEALNAALPSHL